jgi:acyl carrier protein
MSDIGPRLTRCFSAVFPGLTNEEIQRATAASVSEWDSVGLVTLAAVIEEEFSFAIQPDEYEQLTSFDLIRNLVERKLSDGRV